MMIYSFSRKETKAAPRVDLMVHGVLLQATPLPRFPKLHPQEMEERGNWMEESKRGQDLKEVLWGRGVWQGEWGEKLVPF